MNYHLEWFQYKIALFQVNMSNVNTELLQTMKEKGLDEQMQWSLQLFKHLEKGNNSFVQEINSTMLLMRGKW